MSFDEFAEATPAAAPAAAPPPHVKQPYIQGQAPSPHWADSTQTDATLGEVQPAPARQQRVASVPSAIVNLAKTCVGTGILTLPFAFKGCGMLFGAVFTALTGAMAALTLFLLCEVASEGGTRPSLNALGRKAGGTFGSVLVDVSVCMNNVGAMISYLVIASTTVQRLVKHGLGHDWVARQVYVAMALVLVAPLCLVRRVHMLRFSSFLAIVALAWVTVMIVLFSMPWSHSSSVGHAFEPCKDGGWGCKGDVLVSTDIGGVITQFVIFTNAYTCQHAMVPIVAELHRPTRARRLAVVTGAMGMVCLLLMLVGVAGYWTFGDTVDSNVLFSYPQSSPMVLVALSGIVIDVLSSYPLLMFVTRISVLNLFTELALCCGLLQPEHRTALEQQQDAGHCKHFVSSKREIWATLFIMCCTTGVALAVSDLGIVAALTGATGATMVGYIVPGFLYARLYRARIAESNAEPANDEDMDEELLSESAKKHDIDKQEDMFEPKLGLWRWAVFMLVLGCVLVPTGITLTLTQ